MARWSECEEALGALEAHLDGELDGAAAAAFAAHLDGCASCAAELELAARVRRELRALPQLDAPAEVVREVFRRAGEARFRWRPAVVARPAWAALAAAVLAAVVGAGLWLRSAPAPPPAAAVDAAAVARATEEARYALALVAQVGRRTGLKLRQEVLPEHLVDPSVRSLSRAFVPGREPKPAVQGEVENGTV